MTSLSFISGHSQEIFTTTVFTIEIYLLRLETKFGEAKGGLGLSDHPTPYLGPMAPPPTETRIQRLPETLVNQIAAGEVVQRPASVVKELLENSRDAGATRIELHLKDAGKTLVQVKDNGHGMGPADARLCFERHATSKIRELRDLFAVRSYGFRGEALASIAAVAQVELRTRRAEDPVGTRVVVGGGTVEAQEPSAGPVGTTISVKNLFYNVPARRRFLKSDPVELRHALHEVLRLALAHPELHVLATHNEKTVYDLAPGSIPARLAATHDRLAPTDLIPLTEETEAVVVTGYLGKPGVARRRGSNYFFLNGRFVRDGRLHGAVKAAYGDLLAGEQQPFYALYLTMDPNRVDINIHPTKTEVQFQDERTVSTVVHSAARKALGQFLNVPERPPDAPPGTLAGRVYEHRPVNLDGPTLGDFRRSRPVSSAARAAWGELLSTPEKNRPIEAAFPPRPAALFERAEAAPLALLIIENRFVLLPQAGGVWLVDRRAAHARVRYEQLQKAAQAERIPVQQLLYPFTVPVPAAERALLERALPELLRLGFDLKELDNGDLLVNGLPGDLKPATAEGLLPELLRELAHEGAVPEDFADRVLRTVAERGAVPPGRPLAAEELQRLVNAWLACSEPARAPDGRPTYATLTTDELADRLRKG